jgi:hypothetical protein
MDHQNNQRDKNKMGDDSQLDKWHYDRMFQDKDLCICFLYTRDSMHNQSSKHIQVYILRTGFRYNQKYMYRHQHRSARGKQRLIHRDLVNMVWKLQLDNLVGLLNIDRTDLPCIQ